MKFTIFAAVFALAIAAVSAQTLDLSQIPACAATCAFSSIGSTKCSTSDYKCICDNTQFLDTLAPCVEKQCDAADQQKILSMATTLCASYGVTIPSDILLTATASTTASASTSNGAATTATSTSSSAAATSTRAAGTNGAAKLAGSGFVAAAFGAAMFML